MSAPIQVLLATWNGERWLPALLESLAAQTTRDFTVLARDDGSSDGTVELLRRWGREHGDRLALVEDGVSGCGASGNFGRLMAASTAPYVMFCDQDDVWRPRKVAVTVEAMRKAEGQRGVHTPLYVHTDLQVVDGLLNQLDSSFWHYQKLDPQLGRRLHRVAVQNVVTGCASMANRALLTRALPVPPAAIMHDWWLAMTAAAFGDVPAVNEATIQYRQHGGNDTGAKHWSAGYVWRKFCSALDSTELQETLAKTRRQAAAFLDRFGSELTPAQRRPLEAYAGLDQRSFLGKRLTLLRHGLLKIGLIRNLGMLARI